MNALQRCSTLVGLSRVKVALVPGALGYTAGLLLDLYFTAGPAVASLGSSLELH